MTQMKIRAPNVPTLLSDTIKKVKTIVTSSSEKEQDITSSQQAVPSIIRNDSRWKKSWRIPSRISRNNILK